ncbi:hypothetical protein D3C83_48540 [compost metagenome]
MSARVGVRPTVGSSRDAVRLLASCALIKRPRSSARCSLVVSACTTDSSSCATRVEKLSRSAFAAAPACTRTSASFSWRFASSSAFLSIAIDSSAYQSSQ